MNKQRKFNQQNSKFILEELEERRLFSGGIEGLIVTSLDSDENALYADANKSQSADTQGETAASAAEQQSQEIVFVDAGVDNHQQLVDDLLANSDSSRNIEVVVLDRDQDGIEQISATLQNRDDLDAIHIISHGSDGSVELGNTSLNSGTLEDNNLKIALWANSFAETGDILIYGCNLAATEVGQSLVSELSGLTLTDVAASDDVTGSIAQGGDWNLEYTTGSVEASTVLNDSVSLEQTLGVSIDEPWTNLAVSTDRSTTISADHTVTAAPGSDRLLVVTMVTRFGNDQTIDVTSATFGGIQLHEIVEGSSNTTRNGVWMGYLLDSEIPDGEQSLSVSFTSTVSDPTGTKLLAATYVGVDQTTPVNDSSANNTKADAPISFGSQIDHNAGGEVVYVASYGGNSNTNTTEPAGYSKIYTNEWSGLLMTTIGHMDDTSTAGSSPASTAVDFEGIDANHSLAVVALNAVNNAPTLDASEASLWMSTTADVSGSAAPGLANWTNGEILEFGATDLSFGENTTAGTFSSTGFSLDAFAAGADIDALHYVTQTVTVGSDADAVTLLAGDLLLSTQGGETLTSTNTLSVDSKDLFAFRPDTPGDYTSGTFIFLLDDPLGGDLKGVSLVEQDTTVGDVTLQAGTFVLSEGDKNLYHYSVDTVGFENTSGNATTLVEGADIGIDENIIGVALVQNATSTGGITLNSGQLLVTLANDDNDVGGLDTERQDIIALNITQTGTNTLGSATDIFFDGDDVGLIDNNEDLDALTLVSPLRLDPIVEDTTGGANTGTLVSDLINNLVTDVDADPEGIAITGADETNGAWEYSTNGGSSWQALGAVADNSARVLSATANDLVRFVPDADFEGSATISIRAWDGTDGNTSGTAGVDVSTNGGTTAYSSATATGLIEVRAVNDAPVLDNTGAMTLDAIDEDDFSNTGTLVSGIIASAGGDRITDIDLGAIEGMAVTGVDNTNGTWEYSTDGGTIWTAFGAVADNNATVLSATADDRIRFVPNADFYGSIATGITFRAWDASDTYANGSIGVDATTNGGTSAFSVSSETVAITINGVNDAPVNTIPVAQAVNEDAELVFSGANGNLIAVNDIDMEGNELEVTLSVANGTLTLNGVTGLTFNAGGNGQASMTFTGTAANVNAALDGMSYLGDPDYVGADNLTITTGDQGFSGSGGAKNDLDMVAITVDPVNDTPVNNLQSPLVTTEDVPLTISTGNGNLLWISDVDADTDDLEVSLTVTHGSLTLSDTTGLNFSIGDGTADTTMKFKGTVSEINAALDGMVFSPVSHYAGSAIIEIATNDQGNNGIGGALTDIDVFTITVTPDAINDAPLNTLPGAQSVDEEGTLILSVENGNAISINDDADGNLLEVTLTAADGTITLSNQVGSEFQINTETGGSQRNAEIVATPGGGTVVVWTSNGQDGNGEGVYAQVYDAEGLPLSAEIRVNTTTADHQKEPAIAVTDDGSFVVVWTSKEQDGDVEGIFGQRFDAAGNPLGGEFQVNSYTLNKQMSPDVAMDAAGNFVVVWQSKDQDGDREGIYAQRYDNTGATVGGEVLVNTTTAKEQKVPAVAMDDAGNFVVVWQSKDQDGGKEGIFGRRFDAGGPGFGAEFQINTFSSGRQSTPDIAMSDSGEFVVAWESQNQDGSRDGIYAQRFDATATTVGSEFQVNSTTLDDQKAPTVSINSGGDFVIVWQSKNQAFPDRKEDVYAQHYAADGTAKGVEVLLNSTVAGGQKNTAVALFDDGGMWAVWDNDKEVSGQRFQSLDNITFFVGDGVDDATLTFRATQDDINAVLNGLRYSPNANFFGATTLTITTNDLGNSGSGGAQSDVDVLNINVNAFNDAPTLLLPIAQSTTEEVPLVFSSGNGNAITVSDVDAAAGNLEITLSAINGQMTLGSTAGISFTTGDGSDDAGMVFSGTLTDINNALEGLSFSSPVDYVGLAQISLLVNDLGNTGTGGALTDSGRVYISIASDGINDAPLNTVPGTQFNSVDTPVVFSDANGNQISISDDSGNLPVEVTLTATNGTLTLSTQESEEFQVNTLGSNNQTNTQIATSANGAYVIVWQSDGNQDGNGKGIFAQLYDPFGDAVGSEITVNSETQGNQVTPVVAMSADGSYVVAWESDGNQDGDGRGIFVQMFDSVGQKVDVEFQINTTADDDQILPAIAIDDNGNFVVVWQSKNQDGSGEGIYAQQFDATGLAVNDEFLVTTTTADHQTVPDVAMDADGDFVIVWQSKNQDGDGEGIYAQQFNASGVPQGVEFQVNVTASKHQTVPSVAMDDLGNFVVTWQSENQDGDGMGICTRRFDALGNALDVADVLVNTTTADDQIAPSVSMNAAGEYVVVWQSKNQDGDGEGVYGQWFGANGATIGGDFCLSTETADHQTAPDVALTDSGDFITTWISKNQDGDGEGVYAQQFPGVAGMNFTTGDGVDDASIVFTGRISQINAALDGMTFTPTPGFNGVASVQVQVDDLGNFGSGGALTDDDTVLLQFNTAPVLDAAGPMSLTTIGEHDFANSGDLVSAIIASAGGDRVTDADAGAVEGIAVTAVDNTNGTWEFSTNGGSTWAAFGALSDSSATVLSATANDLIRFVPDGTFNGVLSPGITFRAWDTIDALASGTAAVDASVNGGNTSFSSATETAGITVTPVNDPPVITSDGGGASAAINVVGNTTAVTTITTTDVEVDTITYSISGGADSAFFSVDPNSGVLTFNVAPYFETPADSDTDNVYEVTVLADDGNGGTDTQAISVTITDPDTPGVNDAPTNQVPGAQTIDRNGIVLFSSATGTALEVRDADASGAALEVVLTATNGTLNLSGTNGLSFTVGDGSADATMTFTGTLTDINVALEGATFVATPGFTGAANLQITTDDLGNTGTGGSLNDTDNVAITVKVPDQDLWLTFESDQGTTGNAEIPSVTAGDVVTFSDITQLEINNTNPLASTTAGTLAYGFNLDTVKLSDGVTNASDGDTVVNAVHYVGSDIQVGSNNIQLQLGDILLSTDANEDVGGVSYQNDDVFVFRPDTLGDYSKGSFFLLIDGNAGDLSFNNVTAISLVEQPTDVGGVTLNPGEFLLAQDGSGKNILHYVPGTLGATTTGTVNVLVAGADINIGQNIGGVHLVQADTVIGGVSLTAGQLLVSIQGNDSTVGDGTTIDVKRQDLFVLDVTATGDGTTAATADRFFEGLDENLDNNNEGIWGIGYQGNIAPIANDATFNVDENSANGTVVGTATASDPEGATLSYSITAGNLDGAFTINSATGQITVANSVLLDFETTPTFLLTVAAIDDKGAYGTASITVNLNDIAVENQAPVITSDGGGAIANVNVAENTTAVTTVTATDPDLDTPTFTITGGADQGLFSVDLNSGVLTFDTAPDFEAPGDVGTNNIYVVEVTADDGNGGTDVQTINVTVTNANETPVIGGDETGSVSEDTGVVAGNIGDSGSLSITDPDAGESSFQAATITGTYGDLTIDTAGNWSYTADNSQAAIQQLDAGQSIIDTVTVAAFDGTTHDVIITINGVEDGSVIGGTATGAVTEDGTLTATDTLTITDVDTNDNPISFNDVAATLGDNGYGNFEITSNAWTYTLNNGHAAVQALDVGQTLNDTFTFTASDGSTQVVTVTINGAEDGSVIGGTATGAVTEDGTLTATDTLTITDVDTNDNPISFNDVAATLGDNGYGNFEITSNAWTYTLNNGHAAVQALDVGQTLNDTFTFTASDGSTQVVTVTINGAEDGSVIGGTATGAVAEDGTLTATDTLTITDVDTNDNPISFNDVAATLGDNGYGDFEITSNTWTYTLNNGHAAVQALDVGQTLNDTFTFTASDGSTQVVTVTINGSEDAAVIGGTATGAVAEDGTLTATDTLTITDVDTNDNPISFNDVAATLGDNGYGNFEITSNAWTYTLNNGHAAVQALDVGQTLNDTFTFTASDGSTQVVTVTINGSEDAAVIGGTATGAVTEDGTLTATDTLTITDVDTSDNPISFNDVAATLGDNGYGDFEITSNAWTYTLNNGHAAVQALDAGQTLNDTFTFTASDGSTQVVTVTINGAEDGSVIGGTAAGAVTEDGTLTATDTLTITDVDTNDNPISFNDVAATLGDNGYGDFEITSNTWTYTLNNGHAAVQALDVGQTLNDTFTFTASDGSTQVVTVTINGSEDAAVIGGTAVGAVTEDGTLTATDTLTITDVDANDNPISFNDVAATLGDNGYGDFEITSNAWTYTLNNGHAAVQALDVGQTLNDTFTFTASDGSTQVVTVTINGAEDAAVIGGTATGAVTEDGTLTATDTLTITDVDTNDNPISFNDVAATLGDNGYGDFEITSNAWTYTLNNGHAAVQALDVGQTLNDTFTFTASDGSTQVVTVTINGSEDAAVIGGTATGAVTEDGTLTATDTLTITDVDTNDNPISFNDVAATLGDNGYGNFEITSNTWTYTLDNNNASIQALDVGQTLNDTFTFTASDGSTQVVTVTINGSEDAAVIGGTATGAVAEDGTLTATDTLTITDVDTNDNPISFNDVAATLGDNGYGDFEITSNTWTYTLNNGHAAVQALDVGQTLNDTFTFTASDGSTQVVTVTINGSEDAAVIDGTATGAVAEDGTLTATDTLTITDVDTNDNPISFNDVAATLGDNGYGNFEITSNAWTYTLNNGHAAVQALDVGQTLNDTFTFTASDGSTQVVTVTINGAEDGSVIGGTATGAVAEDGTLTATDTLTITDVDTNDNPISFNDVAATLGDNGYGDFEITSNAWTYTLNNGHAAVQALDVGQTLNDTFTFTASDGSTQVVTVTINGAEDGSVIGGTATGAVTEDGTLTATDTLTITDVDTNDNPISFNDVAATLGDNGYGNFEITSNAWTYTLDNNNAAVQALDAGQTLNDTFTFTASDGSTQFVTVTINGSEDAAVIGGTATGAVTEDGTLTATDTLTITDVDTNDNPISFNDVAATLGDNGYGNFEITSNAWTYTLNNGHAAVQALDVGQTLNDTFTFTASDGSTQVVTVTINGAEDGSVIGGTATGAVTEDGTLTATDTLTITDVDTNDNPISFNDVAATLGDNGYGNFEITSNAWTYTLDNNNAAVQALDAGQTLNDTFTFTASDGSTQFVTVTINGSEDAAVIGGTATGAVTEDGTLTATDTLTITDVDTNDNPISFNDVAATLGDNGYGNFEITSNAWTYTLNNGHAAVQALDAGQTLNDTFTFTASDGSTQIVTVTINGSEDAAVIGGTAVGAVTEDGTLTATDTLTITDVDTNDNPISFNDVAATLGDNGYGNFEITSNAWTYTLDNNNASVQALDVGQTLNDTFTFTASDGSTQVVTVTINGSEDAAVIGGTATGAVTEDGTLTATDTLTITDVDTSDNPISFNDVAATLGDNGYGNFEITSNAWTYTLDNNNAAVQALDVGQTINDTFTFTASDGSTQVVTVTINGAEDGSVIGGTSTGNVAEDGTLTATDTLIITDVDTNDNPISFNDVAATLGDNGYGNFEITSNAWTYTLNNGHAAVQALDVGQTLNDTFTFTASDGSTQVVTVTINGAEDGSVIGGTATGAVAEDGTLTATDTLTITDVDTNDNPISFNDVAATLGDNGYGDFEITSNAWTYTLNNGHAAVQALDVGQTLNDTFTFTASDGSTQVVTVTINGAEDGSVIGGTATGSVAEDGTLTATDTLTITDVDTNDNPISFNDVAATLGDNGYGDFEITSNAWTYTLNNGHAAVQALDVGQTLNDTFTFTASDGSTQVVTVTINGAEDAAVIGGTATGAVAEDGTLTATDTLTITDVDTNDNPISFNDVAATLGDNGYGDFEITSNAWTYTLNNGHAAVQALDVGQTLNDTFTFTASDGSTQVVTVTINGAEDGSVIGGTATGAVAEDGTLTATDTLTITDVDTNDNPISFNDVVPTLGDNGYGDFEITSNAWTYTLNNGHAAVQALDVGQTLNDTFTFTASDGSTQVVTVTINGAEDAAVIGGTATGAVTEDGTLTATDTLTITDVDTNDNPISFNDVAATLGDNGYGDFEITSNAWTYTLNNGHAAVQALDVGQTLNDTFTFTASDGSTQVVTVTINGAEDGSVIGGTATGAVAEDGTLTATDTLTITDVDTNDNPISFNDVAATLGDNGYGDFEITSNAWTYTLNNGHAAVQALDVGQTLNDTFTFTASDGSTQVVTVTINGAEDGSVIGGTATGAVTEDGTLTATDTLTITDVDTNDNPISFNDVAATLGDNGYGDFEITSNAWTYTLNNGHAAVQALDVGQTLNDTFTFTASDGSTQVVTVTINGAEDGSVIGGTATGAVAEDGTLTATDTLTITDVDTNDNPISFNDVAATLGDNGYGDFEITSNAWTYTLNNGHAAVQALDVGQTLNDTFTFTASDGSTQVVTVTINGAEDGSVIGGTATGAVAEDGTLTATDTLTITDVDTNDNPISFNDVAATLGDNGYGDFEITSNAWTYTLNNGHAAVQALDVGQTLNDTFTFTASDGSTQVVTVTINGAEDGSVIGGTAAGAVAEDGTLTATDTLTITDVDTNDNPITFNDVAATLGDNGYGDFEITSNAWTYTLNNGHAAVQALDVGQTLNDTFTFTASDGSTQVVTVTINGSEDAAVIGGTATGAVAEDGTLTATDTLTITDVDTNDNPISFNDVAATLGDNGYGDFEITSNAWTYTLNNGHAAVQALDVGQTLNDTFTFTASDGSTQVVTVTINGAEDGSVIGGTATGAVAEDGTLTATDTLTITDVDTNDNPITFNDVAATLGDNGYGNFEITSNTWAYTLDNNNASVQALDVGQTLNDTFTFTASDGSTQVVTVTINGAEDGSVIGGTATGAVTEDGTLTATDTLTITDVDTNDNPISFNNVVPTLGDNGYGDFEITSNAWTYTLNYDHAAVQALDVGQTLNDTFTFTASDGSMQVVTVTINGAEDAAVIGGTATGAVAEDGTLTATDTLTITDVDTNDNPISFNDMVPTLGDNGYGNFEITSNTWTYTLDNNNATVQALDVTETLTDTYTFTATDGSTQLVTVTINGAEDAPVFVSSAVTAATEDAAYSYTITTSDVDVESMTITAPTLPPWLTLVDNGNGTATLSGTPTNAEIGNHNVVLNVSDGTLSSSQNFTIMVANANNTPVIGGIDTGVVTEDRVDSTGKLTVAGALTIADPDIGQSNFVAQTIQGNFGALTIDASGNWSYSADNSHAEIQALQAGESMTETLTVTTADGSTHDVEIIINGSAEAPPAPPPPEEPPPDDEPPADEPPDEVEEVQAGIGEDPILEEIIQVPQGIRPPVQEADAPNFAQVYEPDSEPVDYGPVIDKQAVRIQEQPQAIKAQKLNIDALTLQVSGDEALNEQYELELLERIDSMHLGMDHDAAQQNADDVDVQIFVGSTAGLTVGIVSWVLRGGALLASLMSTVPLLNRFDPLPIIKTRKGKEDVEPDGDEDENTRFREHVRKVDNMFSGDGDQEQ